MITRLWGLALVLLSDLAGAAPGTGHAPFQALVDATDPGGTLRPPPGVYAGPVVIDRPITIDGAGAVTIDGGGQGSVVVLNTDGVTLKGLHLRGSGSLHNNLDAGIQVRGRYNVIKDNVIDDCLFGIDLKQADSNVIRRNRIRSKPLPLGLRGDAIRLWQSRGNTISHNQIRGARDTVVWYSQDNVITHNESSHGRYALHFMYSHHNRVEHNDFHDNSVGIFLMYSDGVVVRRNRISQGTGPTAMGIGFKESSDITIEGNAIVSCATGIYLDLSPYEPDTRNLITDNHIAYNGIGVLFHNDWQGNAFTGNRFRGNLTQVAVQGAMTAARNQWWGNYWDDYQGFDRDGDGIGDTPYESYAYADRIWMDLPGARFFKASPMLEVLDFLERLAPFSEPGLLLRDPAPRVHDPDEVPS
jgi:nitrous oxidase accessory protein